MVRRWSYINSLNALKLTSFEPAQRAAFDSITNSTMYLRKECTPSTMLRRRRWARRKHINNWLALSNILKDWALTYRFYRNYNKMVFNQLFTKTSFTAFSIVRAKNSLPCLHKGSEQVLTGSITRRILEYYRRFSNPRLRFLSSFKHTSLITVSSLPLTPTSFETLSSSAHLFPLMIDSPDGAYHLEQSILPSLVTRAGTLNSILLHTFQRWLDFLKAVYRTSVMLTYLRVRL